MRALPDDGWSARADGRARRRSRATGAPAAWCATASPISISSWDSRSTRETGWSELAGGEWWPVAELDAAGLPTLFAKAARLALAAG